MVNAGGFWVAYDPLDRKQLVAFRPQAELEALRFAVSRGWWAKRVKYGTDLLDQLNDDPAVRVEEAADRG